MTDKATQRKLNVINVSLFTPALLCSKVSRARISGEEVQGGCGRWRRLGTNTTRRPMASDRRLHSVHPLAALCSSAQRSVGVLLVGAQHPLTYQQRPVAVGRTFDAPTLVTAVPRCLKMT